MKVVILVVATALVILLIVTAIILLSRVGNKPPVRQDWTVDLTESESHPITSVYLNRGDRREYFGSVNRMDDDYEDKLYQMQSAAEDEAADRNSVYHTLHGGA